LIWKKIFFENFNISEKNVISVELANVGTMVFSLPDIVGSTACQKERKKDTQNHNINLGFPSLSFLTHYCLG
jgi:hypothetical protein